MEQVQKWILCLSFICLSSTSSTSPITNPLANNFRSSIQTVIEATQTNTFSNSLNYFFTITYSAPFSTANITTIGAIADLNTNMASNGDINIDIRFYTSDQSHTQIKVSGLLSTISRLRISLLSVESSLISPDFVITSVALSPFCGISSLNWYSKYTNIRANFGGAYF